MNILILGSGGREHVFAQKIASSPLCSKLFIAPGNAGTAQCGTNLPVSPLDFKAVAEICKTHDIGMIVPGNEDPLVAGIVDYFAADPELCHIPLAGPDKAGARLEGSKDFSKSIMQKYGIPTAAYLSVTASDIEKGYEFLKTLKPPYVLKADGLAAGKGVLILEDLNEAERELDAMLNGKFGNAGDTVVIEEYLHGIELSCFILSDGKHYLMLPEAKDYKRIGEGDTGLNTGGMGAVSPVPFAGKSFLEKVEEKIVKPMLAGLLNEGIVYKGFLFIGLMNVDGEPKVIEFNCRMGDPETEVVFPRIESDLATLLLSACKGRLDEETIRVSDATAVTVFLVSGGYPGNIEKGFAITGTDQVQESSVFHAGTALNNGQLVTSGGRVMAITSIGRTLDEALEKSMTNAEKIQFQGKYYRRDIGQDLKKYYEQNKA